MFLLSFHASTTQAEREREREGEILLVLQPLGFLCCVCVFVFERAREVRVYGRIKELSLVQSEAV
jgi:hypothetical protein